MLEYLFFNSELSKRFESELQRLEQPYQLVQGDETITIQLPEELDDEICDPLDELYDQLFDEQAKLTEQEHPEEVNLVGVQYVNAAGDTCVVTLPPDLVNRINKALSLEELQSMVQTVADSVASNDQRTLCQMARDQAQLSLSATE